MLEPDLREPLEVLRQRRDVEALGQVRATGVPHDIDEGKAQAKYEGGVLMLTLPKKEAPTTRRVAVA